VDTLYEVLDEVAGGGALDVTIVRGTEERALTVDFEAAGAAA
jgi:hypothetical protein